jgi:serine/threonine protein kinase
VLDIR